VAIIVLSLLTIFYFSISVTHADYLDNFIGVCTLAFDDWIVTQSRRMDNTQIYRVGQKVTPFGICVSSLVKCIIFAICLLAYDFHYMMSFFVCRGKQGLFYANKL